MGLCAQRASVSISGGRHQAEDGLGFSPPPPPPPPPAPTERVGEEATRLSLLPPEIVLLVLRHLDTESLCSAAHSCRLLAEVATDASLWHRSSLTVCSRPWPPRPPAALHTLRVCSYRWPSPEHARSLLAWLGGNLRSVQRLELVGRNFDKDSIRAAVELCADARELSLCDVSVQDAWMGEMAKLKQLETVHLDWHAVMSCQQMLQLGADCSSLRLIDSSERPEDGTDGSAEGGREALQESLRLLGADLQVS